MNFLEILIFLKFSYKFFLLFFLLFLKWLGIKVDLLSIDIFGLFFNKIKSNSGYFLLLSREFKTLSNTLEFISINEISLSILIIPTSFLLILTILFNLFSFCCFSTFWLLPNLSLNHTLFRNSFCIFLPLVISVRVSKSSGVYFFL